MNICNAHIKEHPNAPLANNPEACRKLYNMSLRILQQSDAGSTQLLVQLRRNTLRHDNLISGIDASCKGSSASRHILSYMDCVYLRNDPNVIISCEFPTKCRNLCGIVHYINSGTQHLL